jgi:hypothetical protein
LIFPNRLFSQRQLTLQETLLTQGFFAVSFGFIKRLPHILQFAVEYLRVLFPDQNDCLAAQMNLVNPIANIKMRKESFFNQLVLVYHRSV